MQQVIEISVQRRTSLINRLAQAKAAADAASKEFDLLKAEAIEALGTGVHTTKDHQVTINPVSRTTFDQSLAKTYLTGEELLACTGSTEYISVRIK